MSRNFPYIDAPDNKLSASYQYNYTTNEATVVILPDQRFWLAGRWVNTSTLSNTNRTFVFNGLDPHPKHIYYTHSGGFQVGDTNSAFYNPQNKPEDDPIFDSTETRMLCAVYYGGDKPEQFVLLRNGGLTDDFVVPDAKMQYEYVGWGYNPGAALDFGCLRFYRTLDWARAPKYGRFRLDRENVVSYYGGNPAYIKRFLTRPGVQYTYDMTREYNWNDRTPIYRTTWWSRRNIEVVCEWQPSGGAEVAEQIVADYVIQGRFSAEDLRY